MTDTTQLIEEEVPPAMTPMERASFVLADTITLLSLCGLWIKALEDEEETPETAEQYMVATAVLREHAEA